MKKKSRRIIVWLLALALAITGLTLPAAPAQAGGAVDLGDIVQGTNGDGTITAGATVYVTLASLDDAYEEDFAWLYDKGEVICTFKIGDQSVTAARKNNRFSYTTSKADVGKTLCFFTETTGNDTYYNNNTRSYTIIKAPVLSASKKTLYVGESYRLKIKDQIGDAVFTSSDPKVAGVTRGGTIKAKRKGSCVITAQTGGVKLKCKVTVLNPKLSKTRLLTYNS